jgi:hypothetical protein
MEVNVDEVTALRITFKLPIWAQYLLELFLATYGPMIAAAMLIYALFPVAHSVDVSLTFRTFNRILSRPYFPVQIGLGLMTGYVVRARLRTPFTFWVWIIPTIFLGFCVLTFKTGVFESWWTVRLDHFFGSKCQPPECFDQMRCTTPFYTSWAYMLGGLCYKIAHHE